MARQSTVKLSLTSAFDDKGTKAAEKAMSSFEKKFGEVDAATGSLKLGDTTQRLAEQSVQADLASQKWAKVSDSLGKAGEKMTVFATVPIVAAGTAAFSLASDFESSMSRVSGALDDPSADMEALRQLALKTGQDTVFSASEAGSAMEELAKGGLTAADIQGGSLKATMDLAAAGGLGLADAANVVVQSMGAFGLTAGQTGEAANALAGSAAASSADVADLSQGLSQSSAQARLAGWSIQDTTAVLGGFADAGIKGSDAGTSLKTMLQRLAAPTDDAAKAIADLGIVTRDGNGNLLDAAGMADELQTKMGGLSSAQRDAAMQTIFGSDASRAAATMMSLGREGVEKYTSATNDQTAAQRLADSQMGESERAIENMKGAAETAAIQFGTALAPSVTKGADAVGEAAEAFSNLDEHTQGVIVSTAAAVAAAGPLLSVGGKVAGAVSTGYKGYAKLTAELAKFSAGSGTASKAAGILNTAIGGVGKAAVTAGSVLAAAEIGNEISKMVNGTYAAEEAFGSAAGSVTSFADKVEASTATIGDVNSILTQSGQTVGDVSGTIETYEGYITQIIATALDEHRSLRDDELANIEEYNARIAELEQGTVQAYQSGIDGVAEAVRSQGQISEQEAADQTSRAQQYYSTAKQSLDDYYSSRLASLTQAWQVEGSMTQEEYDSQIAALNSYRDQQQASLDQSLSSTKGTISEATSTITGFSDDQKSAMESISDATKKLNENYTGTVMGVATYFGAEGGGAQKWSAQIQDALATVVNDTNSSFLAIQASIATNGGTITAGNATMIDQLLSTVEQLPPGFEDQANETMRALAEGLDSELGIDVANSNAQQIIDAYRSKTDGAREAGGATGQSYAEGLSERTQQAIDAASSVTGLSVDKLGEAASQAGVKGDDATYAFAASLANGATLAEAAAIGNASSATRGLGTGDGSTPASGLAGSYAGTLSGSAWQAFQPGTQLGSQASAGAKSVDGSGAGDNFARGFIESIGDWAQSAWDAGWAFISNALAGGNAAQQSRSPAKKTREMAKWNALGFVNEMESREGDAYDAGYAFVESSLSGSANAAAALSPGVPVQRIETLPAVTPERVGNLVQGPASASWANMQAGGVDLQKVCDRLDILIDLVGDKDVVLQVNERELARWVGKNAR